MTKITKKEIEWWEWKEIYAWDYECWRDDPIWYNKFVNEE